MSRLRRGSTPTNDEGSPKPRSSTTDPWSSIEEQKRDIDTSTIPPKLELKIENINKSGIRGEDVLDGEAEQID